MNALIAEVEKVSSVLLACEHAAEAIATLENYRWAGWVCYILETLKTELMNDRQISSEGRDATYRRLLCDIRQSIDDRLLAYSTLDDEE